MKENTTNSNLTNESVMEIRQIYKLIYERRRFISSFTGIITLLVSVFFIYQITLPIQYKVEFSIVKPSNNNVEIVNKYGLLDETKDTIFSEFLNLIGSKVFQTNLLIEGDNLDKFKNFKEPITDERGYAREIANKIYLSALEIEAKSRISNNTSFEIYTKRKLPYVLSMYGENPDNLKEFLEILISRANIETIRFLDKLLKAKIANRLEEILNEKIFLLEIAKKERFSEIQRIKEQDALQIKDINDLIERARFEAKSERLNEIQRLTTDAKLAGSLGIIENNLGGFSDDIDLNIVVNSDDDTLPNWYLYGEKALLMKAEVLKNRTSDDPYIPELIGLINKISEIERNNFLQALEERQDDSHFIPKISELDAETARLESYFFDIDSIESMQVYSDSTEIIPNNLANPIIIFLALFSSFVMSVFLALFMNSIEAYSKENN